MGWLYVFESHIICCLSLAKTLETILIGLFPGCLWIHSLRATSISAKILQTILMGLVPGCLRIHSPPTSNALPILAIPSPQLQLFSDLPHHLDLCLHSSGKSFQKRNEQGTNVPVGGDSRQCVPSSVPGCTRVDGQHIDSPTLAFCHQGTKKLSNLPVLHVAGK